jgi:hypothetical protein
MLAEPLKACVKSPGVDHLVEEILMGVAGVPRDGSRHSYERCVACGRSFLAYRSRLLSSPAASVRGAVFGYRGRRSAWPLHGGKGLAIAASRDLPDDKCSHRVLHLTLDRAKPAMCLLLKEL